MKTIFNIPNGRLEIIEDGHDCYRDSYGRLGLYGDEQFKMYGSKETLAALIKHRYGITPGKYVRQLGDVIFFFPAKNGLTGSIAAAEWKVEHCYIGPANTLVCFSIGGPLPAQTLCRFCGAVAEWELNGIPLLLYQYGHLYHVNDLALDGRFWLKDITDPRWLKPILKRKIVSLLKMHLHDLLYWQGMLPAE